MPTTMRRRTSCPPGWRSGPRKRPRRRPVEGRRQPPVEAGNLRREPWESPSFREGRRSSHRGSGLRQAWMPRPGNPRCHLSRRAIVRHVSGGNGAGIAEAASSARFCTKHFVQMPLGTYLPHLLHFVDLSCAESIRLAFCLLDLLGLQDSQNLAFL
jgi:hypothetical protein